LANTATVTAAHGARTLKTVGAWHLFLATVSFMTLLPFVAVPFIRHVIADSAPAQNALLVLSFFGANFHVAATGWFYTDPAMRAHFRSKPMRYLIVPALLVAGSAALFLVASQSQRSYLLVVFFCWQLWHYQKQNVGLLSFIAAGTDGSPLSVWERRTLMVAAVAGILGCFGIGDIGSLHMAWLQQVGVWVYLLVPVGLGIALIKSALLRTNWLRLAFLICGALFFLPAFIFNDPLSAIVSFGLAHGLQYLVFMGVVSTAKRDTLFSAVLLLGIATVGGVFLDMAKDAAAYMSSPYVLALNGVFYGAVMAHFVLDAGIWRLREPFQRRYIRDRFSFVFDR
jgi:hypothetical protein